MIVEYKNRLVVKATFKDIYSMRVNGEYIVLVRKYYWTSKELVATNKLGNGLITDLPTSESYEHTVAILRLGMGEYVEVVNELAGS
jgi:hypothetical protein